MKTWQSDLISHHPGLFIVVENGRSFTPGIPCVGDGWRDLVERAVSRIADTLATASSGSVTIVEIKAKYATLRMYWTGTVLTKTVEDAVADIVATAEARSACTCETCGAAGVLHRAGRQLLVACAEHGSMGAPVPIEPGWENLHLLRGTRDGKTAVIVCRRYDRETDSFIDVDPQSLGTEE
jgi:hypothetical protein